MNKYEIVKFVDEEVKLDVNISPLEKTIWISIEQMSILFERDRSVISKHIKNIFLEVELLEDSVCAFFAHTANDGKVYNVKYYNLDVVISVGYRVKSKRGVLFRQWASNIIQDYLIKGYAINEERSLVTNENYVRLINKVESLDERVSNIENNYKFNNNDIIIVGCSGGPDSMALLDMLIKIRDKYNLTIIVAHVNYNVREDSLDSEYVEDMLAHKYPFHINIDLSKRFVTAKTDETIFKVSISFAC